MYFDIGANVGRWALANASATDKIIAIEADPQTHAKLVANTQGTNIVCENYAVCDSVDYVTFYSCSTDTLSTLNRDWLTDLSSRFCGQPFTEIKCPAISIDTLIIKYGTPDLIKVDVEGASLRP